MRIYLALAFCTSLACALMPRKRSPFAATLRDTAKPESRSANGYARHASTGGASLTRFHSALLNSSDSSGKPKMFPSFRNASFDANGEKRLAERLLEKLPSDYIIWCNIPVGPKLSKPDFILLHPLHGLLVLEVKDYNVETVLEANKTFWTIQTKQNGPKQVCNPLEQARKYAQEIARCLENNPNLVFRGRDETRRMRQGQLVVGWNYGVVFTRMTRSTVNKSRISITLEPSRILCKNEMTFSVSADDFTAALQDMCYHKPIPSPLTHEQVTHIRATLFPELCLQNYGKYTARSLKRPMLAEATGTENRSSEALRQHQDLRHVMDLQQEHVARNMGNGHRVIGGVAGSGKTVLLGFCARRLAETGMRVLVVCYNQMLAVFLTDCMLKGSTGNIEVATFHQWCHRQLIAHRLPVPVNEQGTQRFFDEMVADVASGIKTGVIPRAQYDAILVDEAHDFEPAWLRLLAVDMLNPATQDLLIAYDNAQNIYRRRKGNAMFTWKSVGVKAQGRATILRVNYRNTVEILRFILNIDREKVLRFNAITNDGEDSSLEPLAVRHGCLPEVLSAKSIEEELRLLVEKLRVYFLKGYSYGETAVLCMKRNQIPLAKTALEAAAIPVYAQREKRFNPLENSVKVMTVHASKGLEFSVVALVGAGLLSDTPEAIKLLHVGGTRAMDALIVGASGNGELAEKLLEEACTSQRDNELP